MEKQNRILFVCLGNICRSPMAEGIFRHKAMKMGLDLEFDSAGTGGWHVGESPDARMKQTAQKHGIDISYLRARKFSEDDFNHFSRIYVMDEENYREVLRQAASEDDKKKVSLLLDVLHPGEGVSVPDPYFGGAQGFEDVYRMLDEAADKVLSHFQTER